MKINIMPITDHRRQYNQEYAQRTHRVSVTLSPDEYHALVQQAHARGVAPTTLAKELILSGNGTPSTPPEIVRDELQALRFLLRNIANNINQIAHHSNTVRHMVNENDLLLELRKMEDTITAWVTHHR